MMSFEKKKMKKEEKERKFFLLYCLAHVEEKIFLFLFVFFSTDQSERFPCV